MNTEGFCLVLDVLFSGQWHYKEGNKVYCESCGSEHRDSAKRRTHRPGCRWREAVALLIKDAGLTEHAHLDRRWYQSLIPLDPLTLTC